MFSDSGAPDVDLPVGNDDLRPFALAFQIDQEPRPRDFNREIRSFNREAFPGSSLGYFACSRVRSESRCRQSMQEEVQNSSRTTFPRRAASVSGPSTFSQSLPGGNSTAPTIPSRRTTAPTRPRMQYPIDKKPGRETPRMNHRARATSASEEQKPRLPTIIGRRKKRRDSPAAPSSNPRSW